MWTKRIGHAPKTKCVGFFTICPKRAVLNNKNKIQVQPLSCLHLLPPPKKIIQLNFRITTFLCHGPLLFSIRAPLCRSHCKIHRTMFMDKVCLIKYVFWAPQTPWSLTFLPWCKPKWSRDELNNQLQIYMALIFEIRV